MATRVSEEEVKEILEADPDKPLIAFITMANRMTDWLADQTSELAAADLKEIERWLSAHCYSQMDQMLAEEKSGDAEGVYQGQFGTGLMSTGYGQTAVALDWTNNLAELSASKPKAKVTWLGTEIDE